MPCGEYAGLQALQPERYDALLYWSASDGLPHVILQALAVGLPVIAPVVGGIVEAITHATGFPIECCSDAEELATSYVRAMARVSDASKAPEVQSLRQAGYELVRSRHCREAFMSRLTEILPLGDTASAENAGEVQ